MAEILRSACLLWVNRVGFAMFALRLLHPQHQTFVLCSILHSGANAPGTGQECAVGSGSPAFPILGGVHHQCVRIMIFGMDTGFLEIERHGRVYAPVEERIKGLIDMRMNARCG